MNTYKHYFDIDPNYFPVMKRELIENGQVNWKSFYPHKTFMRLLEDCVKVLSRQSGSYCKSLWICGAYGTGKSHAALTLKMIWDVDLDEVEDYFARNGLSRDLLNKIKGVRNQGKILTIHRSGSGDINNTIGLIMAVENSIKSALTAQNLKPHFGNTLKNAILEKLSNDKNYAIYFESLISDTHKHKFIGYESVDKIIRAFRVGSESVSSDLVERILSIPECNIAFNRDIKTLCDWIKDVIKENNLKAIFFVWDEFSDFFAKNRNSLTDFQELLHLSSDSNFYMAIVTHRTIDDLFHENSSDRKIVDRFVNPVATIDMPENTAFKLMGSALKIKEDESIKNDWKVITGDLWNGLSDSSKMVLKSTKDVGDEDLQKILPFHPYSALILKHISALFSSNQRSMFMFIRGDSSGDNDFQWFIENHCPDDRQLLTCDMLWNYFCQAGRATNLERGIRSLLETYDYYKDNPDLDDESKRVLKTVLLLQGISEKALEGVVEFKPTSDNIAMAYEGTELDSGRARHILDRLAEQHKILHKQPLGRGGYQYVVLRASSDTEELKRTVEELNISYKLERIISNYKISDVISLDGAMKLRFSVKCVGVNDFSKSLTEIKRNAVEPNTIPLLITFAKNEQEGSFITDKINEALNSQSDGDIVFADMSLCPLKDNRFNEIIEYLAHEKIWRGKDNKQAESYIKMAEDEVKNWKDELKRAEIKIFKRGGDTQRITGIDSLCQELKAVNDRIYANNIEQYSNLATMFLPTQMKMGAKMGAEFGTISGQYRGAKIEDNLKGIWGNKDYLTDYPNHNLSRIKTKTDEIINSDFEIDGKIDTMKIWDLLKQKPYGFMPCNLTAFLLGFLLKDYACDRYTWSNGSITEPMSIDKLAEMIDEMLKNNPSSGRFTKKYIVKMTDEEKAFLKYSAVIFTCNSKDCDSIEKTRTQILSKLRKYQFPLWALNEYIIQNPVSFAEEIKILILSYCELAGNIDSAKKATDIAKEIGTTCNRHKGLAESLQGLIKAENIKSGMQFYIRENKGELIELAKKIADSDRYMSELSQKITADGMWLWKKKDIDAKIDEIILDYKLIDASNRVCSFKCVNGFKHFLSFFLIYFLRGFSWLIFGVSQIYRLSPFYTAIRSANLIAN